MTMDNSTVFGPGSFVRGRISGQGDAEIAGRLEGEVSLKGSLSIENTGLVAAKIIAHKVIVRGSVRGDILAEESISLEDGAKVVGDLKAQRISIASGALVRGHLQTTHGEESKAKSAKPFVSATASFSSKEIVPVSDARVKEVQKGSESPTMTSASSRGERGPSGAARIPATETPTGPKTYGSQAYVPRPAFSSTGGSSVEAPRPQKKAPPPPIVPVLRKSGVKAVHKGKK